MMFFNQKEDDDTKFISPPNLGWIEKKLSKKEIDYLWNCIDSRNKNTAKGYLVGNIHESNYMPDRGDWFFNNTLTPLCVKYAEHFSNIGDRYPTNQKHPYYLESFWVNYQKQGEFNPIHNHNGVYSFVVWMKIPVDFDNQNKKRIAKYSNNPMISAFQFRFSNILGEPCGYVYKTDPSYEGTLLFFPSMLNHIVYPFFDCNEDRISVSGNIILNTAKLL